MILIDRYDRRCIDCNNTFREVFGPAVIVHGEDLVNTNNFQLAWTNLHTIYNTSNPNLVKCYNYFARKHLTGFLHATNTITKQN